MTSKPLRSSLRAYKLIEDARVDLAYREGQNYHDIGRQTQHRSIKARAWYLDRDLQHK